MGTAENIFQHLRALRGGTMTKPDGPAVRRAKTSMRSLLQAAIDIDVQRLDALLLNAPLESADVALLVYLAARLGSSERQRKAAQAKNEDARKYVRAQWRLEDGTLRPSKASFARRYVAIVREKFATKVTADTIARAWLARDFDPPPEGTPRGAHAWTGRFHVARKP